MIKHTRRKLKIIGYFTLPVYLVYCEIVFKLLTVKECPPIAWIPTVLFPAAAGLIISIFTGVSKSNKANRIGRGVILCIFALLFLVYFFVHKQFKTFYELTTVFAGAGGVATGFMDHVARLIFSLSGILAIVLYLAPPILYFIYGEKWDTGERTSFYNILQLLIVCIVVSVINVPVVKSNDALNGTYSNRYSFQGAVSSFGLITGIRLDATKALTRELGIKMNSRSNKKEEVAMSPEEYEENIVREGAVVDAQLEEAASKIVYEKSVMDIDFAELAENTYDTNLSDIDSYVASLTPSSQNEYTGIFEGKNLIMITAEAFSHNIVDPKLTPTLYRLFTKGINFTDYTQQASAGTIGGEYQIIYGLYPSDGGESFMRMSYNLPWFTMASQLTRLGYSGRPYHNGDYTFYDRNITHNAIGYPDEYFARGHGLDEVLEDLWPASDDDLIKGTIVDYLDKQPFNLYYMTVSGHSLYDRSNGIAAKNYEYVENMDMSETLKYYYAANLELEFALTHLLEILEEAGIMDDTVIVLTADHFPYGLDDEASFGDMKYVAELYGYNPMNYLERDKNGLIIWCGELDILPTLSNLFGLEWDSRLFPGRDVFSDAEPLVFDFAYDWKTDKGTYIASKAEFTPVEGATIPPGYVDRINSIVEGKMDYCWYVLRYNYFRHVIEDSGYLTQ